MFAGAIGCLKQLLADLVISPTSITASIQKRNYATTTDTSELRWSLAYCLCHSNALLWTMQWPCFFSTYDHLLITKEKVQIISLVVLANFSHMTISMTTLNILSSLWSSYHHDERQIKLNHNHGNDTFYLIVSPSSISIVMLKLSCLEYSERVDQQFRATAKA